MIQILLVCWGSLIVFANATNKIRKAFIENERELKERKSKGVTPGVQTPNIVYNSQRKTTSLRHKSTTDMLGSL